MQSTAATALQSDPGSVPIVATEDPAPPAAPTPPVDPRPLVAESSRIVTNRLWSGSLRRSVRALVYVPPGYAQSDQSYPVLYLLHGTPGTPDSLLSLGLKATLDHGIESGTLKPMIVVLPTGGLRATSDTEWGDSISQPRARWGHFVARDLVAFVDDAYRTLRRSESRAIAGVSMGGFGAVNLALHNRDLFRVASSWSGYFSANTPTVDGAPGSAAWIRSSPLAYAQTLRPSLVDKPVALSFYSGAKDRFFSENVAFNRLLRQLRTPHRFRAVEGGHSPRVWRRELLAELRFVSLHVNDLP